MSLESIDHIHGGDSLPLGVLSVGDSVTDHVLKENLEETSGLFVNQTRDTLDSTTTSDTTNSAITCKKIIRAKIDLNRMFYAPSARRYPTPRTVWILILAP